MTQIKVDGPAAAAIHAGIDILHSLSTGDASHLEGKTMRIPRWNSDGTEVKSVAQVAALLGMSDDQAARHIVESKQAGVELFNDALVALEEKVRHVRTPAGAKRFGQPIGAVIVRDGDAPLKNITALPTKDSVYDGATAVKGKNGKTYHVFKDPEDGTWTATDDTDGDFWDNTITASSEDALYKALDKKAGGRSKAPAAPKVVPSDKGSDELTEAQLDRRIKKLETLLGSGKLNNAAQQNPRIELARLKKEKRRRETAAKKGTFNQGPNSANSSNPKPSASSRAAAAAGKKPKGQVFDKSKLKKRGMPAAGNVKVGDIVSPLHAVDYPGKVVKIGPVTRTGRVTLYFEDEDGTTSQSTVKISERMQGWAEGN